MRGGDANGQNCFNDARPRQAGDTGRAQALENSGSSGALARTPVRSQKSKRRARIGMAKAMTHLALLAARTLRLACDHS